jgi:predicted TIM-barrel fold metal-dependent hydrolase
VLMGSDFPTIDLLRDAVRIVRKAKATAQVKKKVLGENARKLFG